MRESMDYHDSREENWLAGEPRAVEASDEGDFDDFEDFSVEESREEERKLVEAFLSVADEYLSPGTTEDRKRELLEAGLKTVDYFLLQAVFYVEEYEPSLAKQADLLTFLDDVRFESHRQQQYLSRDSWDIFLARMANHPDSALLAAKALAMSNRETPEALWRVDIDHAKQFLLMAGRYVLKEPRASYLDPEIQLRFEGKNYYYFSELLKDLGEDRVWDAMSDEDIRGAWIDTVDENDSDLAMREKLAHADLRDRYVDARDSLKVSVHDDDIVTPIADGVIGVFDAFGRLQSVSTDDGQTLHRLSDERLFAHDAKTPESDIKRKRQAVRDVESVMDLRVREIIEDEFGIQLSEMTLREQVWFASTLREMKPDNQRRLEAFTKNHGIDGARAFLSAEFGDEFHEYILEIGETLETSVAEQVFAAYAKIAELAQTEAGELLETFFVKGKGEPVDSAKIEMELLTRAKRVIEDFAHEAITAKATGKKPDSKALLKRLEQANADTALFASIFKAAFKGKKGVDFEAIRGVEFETTHPEDLSDKDKEKMLAIHLENWVAQNPESAPILQASFEKALQGGDRDIYILRKDGDILAFARFDREDENGKRYPEGVAYFGSFNVNAKQRGAALGEAMLGEMFARAADKTIVFESDTLHDITLKYVEDAQSVIDGIVRKVDGTSDDVFVLSTSLAIRERSLGKGLSKEQILSGVVPKGVVVESFSGPKARAQAVSAIEQTIRAKRIASRFFKEGDRLYVVTEPQVIQEELAQTG